MTLYQLSGTGAVVAEELSGALQRFRKVCWTLHREIGFLVVGLTIVYAVSGIAVNHAHHWDANYARVAEPVTIAPTGAGPTAEVEPLVLERLGLTAADGQDHLARLARGAAGVPGERRLRREPGHGRRACAAVRARARSCST